MVNKPKIAGTNAESAVVRWLQDNGHPQAERRSLKGGKDWGDITGIPGICVEVKAGKTLLLAQWLRETETERNNSRSDFGILVVKPVGMGATRTGQWWAAMYHRDWDRLKIQATASTWACPGDPFHDVAVSLSGAKINRLSKMMTDKMYLNTSIVISPKGLKDPGLAYVVTTLERLNRVLVQAGYGWAEGING